MSKINDLIQSLCSNGVFYKTVGEICKISRGIVMSKISIRDNAGDYPVYSSQTENNGELGKINTFMYEGEYLTWTTDGANAGSVFYRNGKFSVTNVCGLLNVVDKSINIKFLYYVLQTATKPYINKGMGNAKLMSNVMATVPVPIPPLDVQCEIVRILDNFTELTAELTAELTTRKKQYEYYRNYVLTFDNKVEWKPLWSLLFFDRRIYGIEKTKQLKILKFIHVTAKKLEELLDYGDIKLLSTGKFVGYTNISNAKNFVNNGEVIAIPAGGTANLKYWNGKFVDGGNILCSSSDTKKYSLKYIYHCLINKFNIIEQYYRGGSIKHPDMKNIIEIQIPIPPLPIQEKIVNALDNFEKICSDLQIGLPAEIEARKKQYEFYRNKLLSFDLNVTINSTIRNERERERERDLIKMLQYVFGYANVQLQLFVKCNKGSQLNKNRLLNDGYPVINGGIKPSGFWHTYNYLENTITICQGGNAGYIDWQNKKFWAGAHCYVLTNNNQNIANYRYIYFALKKSEHILMHCKYNASTIPGLPIKNVNALMIPLPSLLTQEKIVNVLDNFEKICSDLQIGLPAEIEARKKQYEYYRNKLLTFNICKGKE